MKLNDFILKYQGKYTDFDGYYGGQCVDLYRQYCKEALNFPQSPAVNGAADIWDTYLKDYFGRIANTPTGIPNEGNIVIWSKSSGGGFGHVAIFIEGNASSFRSFDQNWPVGSPCQIVNHYYTNVLGWLVPKGGVMADYYKGIDLNNKESVKVCVDVWKDVIDGNYVKKGDYAALEKQLKANDEAWKERVANEKKQLDDFISVLADKLSSTQTEPAIIEQVTRLIQVEDNATEPETKTDKLEKRVEAIGRLLGVDDESIEEAVKKLMAGNVAPSIGHSRICQWLADKGL